MSRRSKYIPRTDLLQTQIDRRLEKGYRFHHVLLNGTVMPILARNTVDALSLFNLWQGKPKNYDFGYTSGNCGIVLVTDTIPPQFCMFFGRRKRGVCIRHIVMV